MKRISIHIFIAFLLLLQSCIRDDQSTCNSELLLRFRYTLNDQYANLFDSEINRITVYLFDSNNKYVDSFSEAGDRLTNDYVMHIPLVRGKYNVVVYGGDLTTYSVGELNNNTLNQTLRKGVTDINDFRIELQNVTGEDGYLYTTGIPDDLYVGLTTNAIASAENKKITDVELIKNTKKIKVTIMGSDAFDAPLDIYITALNGRYNFDNSIDINHGTFKYLPINTRSQSSYMGSDLRIMRLVLGHSPMLVIKNSVTQDVLYNEHMIDQILATNKYVSQEDLDREDEFLFEISIVNDVIVFVSINGWRINSIHPDM